MQSHSLSMTPVSIKQQKVISWRKSRETQEALKDKTGWHSQTLVQCRNWRHHQTWRSKSRVCHSRRRGRNLPSHNNRDSKSTKERSNIKIYYKQNAKTPEKGMHFQLIENTKVLCKEHKLVIPASLQHRAVSWYHQYLQHPGHSRLEETKRFRDILERYATHHPIICQILQILPGQ